MPRTPPIHTLKAFLAILEKEGQLKRITREIDPHLEAAKLAVEAMRDGGPALLFENIRGSNYPLAMNVLASDRRVELAVGDHPGELGAKLLHLVETIMPPKPKAIWRGVRPLAKRLLSSRVTRSGSGEPLSPVDLAALPILQTWPDDGGKFITLPQVVTYDPVTGKRNIGMYRMHVFNASETGMHWQIQKGGGFHYARAESLNRPLEVAVAVGSDPALLLATIAPLPEGIDEAMFAGFLRGSATRMTRGTSIGIDVPRDVEFLFEGVVAPEIRRHEGPFGDHFGHYSHAGMFPVFSINGVRMASKPVFAATVVGKPPMEDKWLGDATQLILGPLVKLNHPEVKDVWAFYEAGFHNLLGVATEQRYGKEAIKSALSLATDAQLALTKCAIMVSPNVNNRDFRHLLRAIGKNFDPKYDFALLQNVPLDTLDFTSYSMNMGSKLLLDATEKLGETASGGRYRSRVPSEFTPRMGKGTGDVNHLDFRIVESSIIEGALLVVKVQGPFSSKQNAAVHYENDIPMPARTPGREVIEKLVAEANLEHLPNGVKLVAAVSEDVDIRNDMELIWGIFTRFDAARDIVFTRTSLVGVSPVYEGIMGIDATWKPGYPNPCLF